MVRFSLLLLVVLLTGCSSTTTPSSLNIVAKSAFIPVKSLTPREKQWLAGANECLLAANITIELPLVEADKVDEVEPAWRRFNKALSKFNTLDVPDKFKPVQRSLANGSNETLEGLRALRVPMTLDAGKGSNLDQYPQRAQPHFANAQVWFDKARQEIEHVGKMHQ